MGSIWKELIEIVVPSHKQRLMYFLLSLLLGGILFAPEEAYHFYFSSILPYLREDKAVGILLTTTLLFAFSTYRLRREKDAEIKKLNDTLSILKKKTLQLKDENNLLNTRKNMEAAKDAALEKLTRTPKISP
jgi:hypothetical protein